MVDTEYSLDNYKSLKISIAAAVDIPEMLKFLHSHLQTKMMYKQAVKKLLLVIRYVTSNKVC